MDIDAVVKGGGKKGGPKFSGSCYSCGKVGHRSSECRSTAAAAGSAPSAGTRKGAGKGGKGSKSKSNISRCNKCGRVGHWARDCTVHGVEHDKEDEDEVWYAENGDEAQDHADLGGLELEVNSVSHVLARGKMRFGIDSGAAVTVIGKDVAPDYPARAGLKRTLRAANGAAIPEYGCKRLVVSGAWGRGIVKAAAAGVSKNLLSVSQLVDAGNEVVFRPTGAFIRHTRTGRHMPLIRRSGVFELEVALSPFKGLKGHLRRAVLQARQPDAAGVPGRPSCG